MRARRVVTAFLEHQGKILILKRSDKVRTYKRHWAGVSGSIEADESPDERVETEIEEETSLNPKDIHFVRKGRPLRIEDGDYLWTVYPFLYRVPQPDRVKIDWEHTEKRWIYPDEIAGYETVKNLEQTLKRVYLASEIAEGIDKIEQDRAHGASELASMALDVLKTAMEFPAIGETDELFEYLSNIGWHLHHIRPSMSPLINAIAYVLYQSQRRLNQAENISDFKRHILKIIDEYKAYLKDALAIIYRDTKALLSDDMTIFTHSYSSTVVNAILASGRRNLNIIVTESRPLNEGVKTATKVAQEYDVTLITDAQAGYFIANADIVLMGADSILSDGSLINKVGTHLIALAAQKHKVPVYALCQTNKFHLRSYDGETIKLEEKDGREVISENIPNVSVRNIYFEITPAELISGIVTEKGILGPKDFASQLKNWRKALACLEQLDFFC
ncbi:TPA: NUDIX domain-containing protein [Candidatus Poribacteria bacterium]|nr:NUDIX domain-containing protein [Candidatus Poribacteria bacterium]